MGEDLAEFAKNRNTDHDFPPPFMWAEINNTNPNCFICKMSSFENHKICNE